MIPTGNHAARRVEWSSWKPSKKHLNDKGLKGKIRAQRSGCLDACDFGPSMVVYPEGIYYGGVQLSDVDESLMNTSSTTVRLQRLITDFSKVKNSEE